MKSLEIRSKSKEEAISKAIEKLNVKLDDLEIEVLENPTKGFLGFSSVPIKNSISFCIKNPATASLTK